ncbi:MAG TPA: ferrochelatase [bacterium]|nr:ferrochelatase [bacterium]
MATGILLANFGGPRTLEEIPLVLRDLFADPDIFQTPLGPLGQRALAEVIVRARTPKVRRAYGSIGGKSPLYEITQRQAVALGAALKARGFDGPIAIGMRYGLPSQHQGTEELLSQGIDRLLVVPLYPHYSLSTVGSTINEQRRVMAALGKADLPWDIVPPFPKDAGYIQAVAATIVRTLQRWEEARLTHNRVLMFSAHGLPQSFVDAGDPYPKQVRATVQRVLQELGYTGQAALTFQSRVGPVEWLKPYTDEAIPEWADQGVEGIIAVPISFVADNLESLEEIDIEYRHLAWECGIQSFMTVPCVNDDPAFIQALADLVGRRLGRPGPIPAACTLPGRRKRSGIIGLEEYREAVRLGQPFDPYAIRVEGPWKAVRRRRGKRSIPAPEGQG